MAPTISDIISSSGVILIPPVRIFELPPA
jgi:hypothetical protein